MKLILNIYSHGEVMHMKFFWGAVGYSRVLCCLNFNDFGGIFSVLKLNKVTNG